MSRKIIIDKYENNTHYSITVVDKFDQKFHLGYESSLDNTVLGKYEQLACDIWANEVESPVFSIDKAIAQCIEIDIANGKEPSLD